jgi:hypothetical protein
MLPISNRYVGPETYGSWLMFPKYEEVKVRGRSVPFENALSFSGNVSASKATIEK